MPIFFDLEPIRSENNCDVYLETGLWDPCNENISLRKALKANFKKVFSIEIRDDWIALGKEIFADEIASGRLEIIKGDSAFLSKYLTDPAFQEKTMFFLDAHVDNSLIQGYKYKCPLFHELKAIKNLERKDNVILVDDIRVFMKPNPWGEMSYGEIDYLKEIKNLIKDINPKYRFERLDGHITDDVMFAHI